VAPPEASRGGPGPRRGGVTPEGGAGGLPLGVAGNPLRGPGAVRRCARRLIKVELSNLGDHYIGRL